IVAVDTDEGVTGWGEMAPLGAFYADAFAEGARAGIAVLAPHVVGADPAQPRRIVQLMDAAMRGQPYVKSALDMACWDATARLHGQPLCEALGGRFGAAVDLYRSISPAPLDAVVERARAYVGDGYRRLQIKVGGDPAADAARLAAVRDAVGPGIVLFADANGGWTTAAARRFMRATEAIDHTLEQPCATLEECALVRPHCDHPLVLDESIVSLPELVRARREAGADGVTIKLARVGGVTRAAALRDVAVELGMTVTVEDTGGATIDTAAMLHLSHSTPEPNRAHTVDFTDWVTIANADGLPEPEGGRRAAPAAPGLGVTVRVEALGEPFFRTS
ncbi:MAG TPA: mandelate racemase/muconate lactonizing enzyme family protein, partial [Gaiellales bacterium]